MPDEIDLLFEGAHLIFNDRAIYIILYSYPTYNRWTIKECIKDGTAFHGPIHKIQLNNCPLKRILDEQAIRRT